MFAVRLNVSINTNNQYVETLSDLIRIWRCFFLFDLAIYLRRIRDTFYWTDASLNQIINIFDLT